MPFRKLPCLYPRLDTLNPHLHGVGSCKLLRATHHRLRGPVNRVPLQLQYRQLVKLSKIRWKPCYFIPRETEYLTDSLAVHYKVKARRHTRRFTSCPGSAGSRLILLWLISKVSSDGIRVSYKRREHDSGRIILKGAYDVGKDREAVILEIQVSQTRQETELLGKGGQPIIA